jgi:hypothetical protein
MLRLAAFGYIVMSSPLLPASFESSLFFQKSSGKSSSGHLELHIKKFVGMWSREMDHIYGSNMLLCLLAPLVSAH